MKNEVNVQRSKLSPDGMLHIEFLDGNSYLYSLKEIADIISAQHTPAGGRAEVCPECDSEIEFCMMGHYCGGKRPLT
jgi:hypothetical protein